MFGYLRSIVDAFHTQEIVQPQMSFAEKLVSHKIIETTNECGEKRYIETQVNTYIERKRNLEVLLTKCKRLLSFVTIRKYIEEDYIKVVNLHDKVRQALYKDDDITPLIEEFENLQNRIKKSSRSFRNLSSAHNLSS
jgi:cell fate (sporulation/competence/biofilm development) regulator YlbF (YheA/YmcA/DUF963 family)